MPRVIGTEPPASRRNFLKTSGIVVAGTAVASMAMPRMVHAGVDDTLKIGLIGCGGRGTGAAADALRADKNIKLVAMGDAFADRLEQSLKTLQDEARIKDKLAVDNDHKFVGFDAYKKVLESGIDVVLLTTPPHFRPMHFKAAIEAGKHVFCEKPVAVDAPGVRSVLETAELAKQKNLNVVSGLCWRYDLGKREAMSKILDGAIGDVQVMHSTYNTQALWHHGRKPEWSDMEFQMRNWLYFTWLSGDHIAEQHVHSLDKAAWVMHDEPPVKATSIAGRQVRTDEKYGNVFDHFSTVYEYANGVKLFSSCRQQAGCSTDVNDHFIGTKGYAQLMAAPAPKIVAGGETWQYRGPKPSMYQVEHNELFAAVRSGKTINNGTYMARSTMMAVLGRMSGYTGQTISWDDAFNSDEDLSPAKYEFGPLSVPPVALPGITKFVGKKA